MSKSNPRLENPATKFIEFKGDTGQFFYYDKESEEKKEVKMPIYFVVLDELSAIKGYNNQLQSGIYSNEIRSIKDDLLNVRSFKGGIQIVGKYTDIKDKALREGGKFCKSVYAMLITGKGQYELVNFQFHGASFSAWLDKKINTEKFGICIKECAHKENGSIKYQEPVFTKVNLTADVDSAAIDMDRKLQVYLASYLNQQIEKEVTEVSAVEQFYPDIKDDFEQARKDAIENQNQITNDLPF